MQQHPHCLQVRTPLTISSHKSVSETLLALKAPFQAQDCAFLLGTLILGFSLGLFSWGHSSVQTPGLRGGRVRQQERGSVTLITESSTSIRQPHPSTRGLTLFCTHTHTHTQSHNRFPPLLLPAQPWGCRQKSFPGLLTLGGISISTPDKSCSASPSTNFSPSFYKLTGGGWATRKGRLREALWVKFTPSPWAFWEM